MVKSIFYILLFTSIFSYSQQNNTFKEVETVVNKAIEDKAFPGAVVLVWKDGKYLI